MSSRDELADALRSHDLVVEVQLVLLEFENRAVVDLQFAHDWRVTREVHDQIDQSAPHNRASSHTWLSTNLVHRNALTCRVADWARRS